MCLFVTNALLDLFVLLLFVLCLFACFSLFGQLYVFLFVGVICLVGCFSILLFYNNCRYGKAV